MRGMAAINRAELNRLEENNELRHEENGVRVHVKDAAARHGGKYVHLRMWAGKRSAPDYNYLIQPEKVEATIAKKVASEASNVAYKAEQKTEGKSKAAEMADRMKVGTLLHGSWGYDQTNCEFYQVVGRPSARFALVLPIAGESVPGSGESHGMSCNLRPVRNAFLLSRYGRDNVYGPPKPIRKRIDAYGLSFPHHSASPCAEGSSHYSSWYA